MKRGIAKDYEAEGNYSRSRKIIRNYTVGDSFTLPVSDEKREILFRANGFLAPYYARSQED